MLGGEERDDRFVVEGDHEVTVGERLPQERFVHRERALDRLIAEEVWIGREPTQHLAEAGALGLPVLVQVIVRASRRRRRLLDRSTGLEVLAGVDLRRLRDEERGQDRSWPVAAGDDLLTEDG